MDVHLLVCVEGRDVGLLVFHAGIVRAARYTFARVKADLP